MSRLKEDGNLLRSHYYLLVNKYQSYAVPLVVNGVTAYLHKGLRGYSYNHFSHTQFKSLIRILGFKFFNLKFTNFKDILSKCNDWSDCEYVTTLISNDKDTECKVIRNQKIYTKSKRYMKDDFLLNVNINIFQERNLGLPLDGKRPIIKKSDRSNLIKSKKELKLIAFFKYINKVLKANVSYILQNCITSVYKELNYKYKFYKIHKMVKIFQYDILPTTSDYITAIKIFDYIENVHNISEKYKHPALNI